MQSAAQFIAQPTLGSPVDLLAALFALALVPILAVCVTSFTRIVVVLGLLRAALGSAALPPNTVIVALAIMLSAAIMAPVFATIERDALTPYQLHRISASQALQRAEKPLRSFMARQTRAADIRAFSRIARAQPSRAAEVPFFVLAPAFLISELRTAFAMGFALALPFAAIDIVVAIVLMSLGMFMVSPNAISLPLKLLLFVVADGWTLVASALVASYR
ncbi:MAG: flagellar type III secretion system pore protein FliP [Candidatus Eremiobacteraeota bacterium]|nr:flagellar type III secretion system pore protein FliP [Candidatus Eremiobacteraeota bacterium]